MEEIKNNNKNECAFRRLRTFVDTRDGHRTDFNYKDASDYNTRHVTWTMDYHDGLKHG